MWDSSHYAHLFLQLPRQRLPRALASLQATAKELPQAPQMNNRRPTGHQHPSIPQHDAEDDWDVGGGHWGEGKLVFC